MGGKERIEEHLEAHFEDRVYSVEDGVVWVSGMNAHCSHVARSMAKEIVYGLDIPCSLVYDDDAAQFGGLEFRYGGSA